MPAVADTDEIDLLRRRVMAVVGHELRTPVTTVRGLAESLVAAGDETVRRTLVDALVRSATRLEHLVDDLLLATGITTAVPVGDSADVDLERALRDAGWTDPIEGSGRAHVRPESLARILEPIVDNAVRHGKPVAARLDGASVEIESAGPELSEGDVVLACEPFYRGERAVMTAPGLGLGLAIARTVGREEGGDVVVRARDGGGLVVAVRLRPPVQDNPDR